MSTWQILHGDVRERLKELAPQSVQCVVTSPPYWGLRDYGHDGQIGLEMSPGAFVDAIVGVLGGVWDAMRTDGVLWLNLGDSYAGGGNYRGINSENTLTTKQASNRGARGLSQQLGALGKDTGLEPKNLVGIPWRVAFALQAAGWYLRSDIIWSKPNPMPESVTDRPTKAHEYLFLLTKSARYYYNSAAIREPYAPSTLQQFAVPYDGAGTKDYEDAGVQNPSDLKRRIVDKQRQHGNRRYAGFNDRWDASVENKKNYAAANIPGQSAHGYTQREDGLTSMAPLGGANKRSVWTIPTQPYPEAHFATFPEALVEPCILAGSKPGDLILDPFCGSGTTLAVAIRHQRNAIGIELNESYVQLARKRIGNVAPLLAEEIA